MFLNYMATCACVGGGGSTARIANAAGRAVALTTFLCIVTPLQFTIAAFLVGLAEPHFELGFWPNGTDQTVMYKTGWVYFMSTCVIGP